MRKLITLLLALIGVASAIVGQGPLTLVVALLISSLWLDEAMHFLDHPDYYENS